MRSTKVSAPMGLLLRDFVRTIDVNIVKTIVCRVVNDKNDRHVRRHPVFYVAQVNGRRKAFFSIRNHIFFASFRLEVNNPAFRKSLTVRRGNGYLNRSVNAEIIG